MLLLTIAGALFVSGCGSSATPSGSGSSGSPGSARSGTGGPAADVLATASAAAHVVLTRGHTLRVELPASAVAADGVVKYSLSPPETSVLTPVPGAAGLFTGVADGTAKINVTRTPRCSPGEACPAYIIEVGAVTVTVSG